MKRGRPHEREHSAMKRGRSFERDDDEMPVHVPRITLSASPARRHRSRSKRRSQSAAAAAKTKKKRGRTNKQQSTKRTSYSGVSAEGPYGRDNQRIYGSGYANEDRDEVVRRLRLGQLPFTAVKNTNVRYRFT